MAKRQVFFSFHYNNDNWRAAQVRNMGIVDNSSTFSDNDWEEVKEKTDSKIEEWIDGQLSKRSCLIVLIGSNTANRKWIDYEIKKAISMNKGIIGIYIHNLDDVNGRTSSKGINPFSNFTLGNKNLSELIRCYDPVPQNAYSDIKNNIADWIELAINERTSVSSY